MGIKTCSICGEDVDRCDFCQSDIPVQSEVVCYSCVDDEEGHFCSGSCWESYIVSQAEEEMFTGKVVDEGEES